MSSDVPTRETLRSRILAFMDDPGAEPFDDLALDVFRRQWADGGGYRAVCDARRTDPASVTDPAAIPAASTIAFKTLALGSGDAEGVFRTSGTTRGTDRRGEHRMARTDLYRASLLRSFRRFVLPDVDRMRILVLTPRFGEAPDSSLAFMMREVVDSFGAPGGGFFLTPSGPDVDGLRAAFDGACREGVPVALLGTAFAFVHLLDALERSGTRFGLPSGSRVMDTGGFKGRSRSVSRDELLDGYNTNLGIPADHVVNEYGMTELSSQFYDASLLGDISGVLHGPHWVRTAIIDPETGAELPDGEAGLIRHLDLANLYSVAAVETEDLGVAREGGFVLLGRAAGAEPRGCSLAVEDAAGPLA